MGWQLWEVSNLLLFHTPHTQELYLSLQKSFLEKNSNYFKESNTKSPQTKSNWSLWSFLEMCKYLTLFFLSCTGNPNTWNSVPLKASPLMVQLLSVPWIKKVCLIFWTKCLVFFLMTSGLVNVHITTKHKSVICSLKNYEILMCPQPSSRCSLQALLNSWSQTLLILGGTNVIWGLGQFDPNKDCQRYLFACLPMGEPTLLAQEPLSARTGPHFLVEIFTGKRQPSLGIKHAWNLEKRDCERLISSIHLSEAVGLLCCWPKRLVLVANRRHK